MKRKLSGLLEIIGVAATVAGVFILFGVGWALIAGGVMLIAGATLLDLLGAAREAHRSGG